MKFTAHEFRKYMKLKGGLENYKVHAGNKKMEFGKRRHFLFYSSAKFYELGIDDFNFLNNLYDEFDGE